jgi:hypothetical protein
MADTNGFELNITVGDSSFQASGEADLVMKALAEFKTLVADTPAPKRKPVEKAPPPGGGQGTGAGGAGSGEKVPIAIFLRRSWPNQAAQATAIFAWAKRFDGKEKLKPGEMEAYWKKVAKKPGNPTAVCQRAEKEGWLSAEGGGYYSITGHGETMVENTPEQQAQPQPA